MALSVTIPISTEVIENNPDCKINGDYEKGRVVITVDTRYQNHYQRQGISTHTPLHWGEEYTYEVQELSGFSWPIRYVVQARQGYYLDGQGQRVHFTTQATGIDSRRKVSAVLMRAAVLLVVIAGAGYRKTSWLLDQLFHVGVSKSSLQRWVDEVAAQLPDGDEIILRLNEKQAIHEAHFDEWFPKGIDTCLLVVRMSMDARRAGSGSTRPGRYASAYSICSIIIYSLCVCILQIAHLTCSDFKVVSQNAKNIKKHIKADLVDPGSILNLGNSRLGDTDHFGQLALRQTKPFSALHDFLDELLFLA